MWKHLEDTYSPNITLIIPPAFGIRLIHIGGVLIRHARRLVVKISRMHLR
jgi:hypothetical protein